MNQNSKSEENKKTKKIAGGTKTSVTRADGSKTIIYDGVSNLHIGRTVTHTFPSSSFSASSLSHSKNTASYNSWKQTSSSTSYPSQIVKTGITVKQVDSLYLNPKQVKEVSNRTPHITFASSKDYQASKSSSSQSDPKTEQPSQTPSFKR